MNLHQQTCEVGDIHYTFGADCRYAHSTRDSLRSRSERWRYSEGVKVGHCGPALGGRALARRPPAGHLSSSVVAMTVPMKGP
jgi:hypothetical protein